MAEIFFLCAIPFAILSRIAFCFRISCEQILYYTRIHSRWVLPLGGTHQQPSRPRTYTNLWNNSVFSSSSSFSLLAIAAVYRLSSPPFDSSSSHFFFFCTARHQFRFSYCCGFDREIFVKVSDARTSRFYYRNITLSYRMQNRCQCGQVVVEIAVNIMSMDLNYYFFFAVRAYSFNFALEWWRVHYSNHFKWMLTVASWCQLDGLTIRWEAKSQVFSKSSIHIMAYFIYIP